MALPSDYSDAPHAVDHQVMDLTTREGSGFDIALRGYARDQVEQRLAEYQAALTEAEYERDDAIRQLDAALAVPVPATPVREMSARLMQILELAEKEAADLVDGAQATANHVLAQASEDARVDLEAASKQRALSTGEARDIHARAQAEADRTLAEGRTEAEQLVSGATREAERIVLAAKDEAYRIQARGRAEAEELATFTNERREAVEREHDALLVTCRQEQAAERARLELDIADLEERRAQVVAELARVHDLTGAGLRVTPVGDPDTGSLPIGVADED